MKRSAVALAAIVGLVAAAHLAATPLTSRTAAEGSMYASFFILDGNSSGDPVFDRNVRDEVAAALTDKGLLQTSPEEADSVVVVHIATPAKQTRAALYAGWGAWEWRASGGALGGSDYYKAGTVVVDIFDAWSKRLLWHRAVLMRAEDVALGRHGAVSTVRRLFKNFPTSGYQPAPPQNRNRATDERAAAMRIIFSTRPAVLVRIDGEPNYAPAAGTEFERVTNASAYLVRDPSGLHYLKIGNDWLEADNLFGSWSRAGVSPLRGDVVIDPLAPYDGEPPVPDVYISTTPAYLVVTDGAPQYVPVNGNGLLYLQNTRATVFHEPTDQQLYVQLPEGWFRAFTSNGPWQPVPEVQLPDDLAWMRAAPAAGAGLKEQ